MEFFQIASFAWIAAIAVSMYLIIVKRQDISHLYPIFHALAWAAASTAIGIAIPLNFFGNANDTKHVSWCWIKAELFVPKVLMSCSRVQAYLTPQIYLYYAPFFVIWLLCCILYYAVHKEVQRIMISASLRSRAEQRISLYLLVFLVCLGVGVINRIQNEVQVRRHTSRHTRLIVSLPRHATHFTQPKHPVFILELLDAMFSPLQGFLNRYIRSAITCLCVTLSHSIVYGLNRPMRERVLSLCCGTARTNDVSEESGERSPIVSHAAPLK